MSLRRAAGVAVASVLAGCSLLTGAADLEVGAFPDAPDTSVPTNREASVPPREDTGVADVSAPDVAAGDAAVSTRLRTVTFENGTLTGPLGADTEIGGPSIAGAGKALDGNFSAALGVSDGLEVAFGAALPEVFVTFLIDFDAVGSDTPVFFRLGGAMGGGIGASAIDLAFTTDRQKAILAKIGPVSFGPGGSVPPGPVYRMGVHVQTIGAAYKVEVFVAPKGLPFVAPVVSGSTNASGGAKLTYLRVGAFLGGAMNCHVDDVLVDTASMPPP